MCEVMFVFLSGWEARSGSHRPAVNPGTAGVGSRTREAGAEVVGVTSFCVLGIVSLVALNISLLSFWAEEPGNF